VLRQTVSESAGTQDHAIQQHTRSVPSSHRSCLENPISLLACNMRHGATALSGSSQTWARTKHAAAECLGSQLLRLSGGVMASTMAARTNG
jgi:hypothetical protein